MTNMLKTIRQNFLTPWGIWLTLLGVILTIALVAGLSVFWFGLSITNLTDSVPWAMDHH